MGVFLECQKLVVSVDVVNCLRHRVLKVFDFVVVFVPVQMWHLLRLCIVCDVFVLAGEVLLVCRKILNLL